MFEHAVVHPFEIGQSFAINGGMLLPDGLHRLVLIDPISNKHYFKRLIEKRFDGNGISLKTRKTHRESLTNSISAAELRDLESKGKALRVSVIDAAKRLSTPKKLKGRSLDISIKNEAILHRLCDPDILHSALVEQSTKHMFALAAEYQISRQQVRRLLNRLLDAGLDCQKAAVPGYSRSGKQKNRSYAKKQGRIHDHVRNELGKKWAGINTEKSHRESIAIFIQSSYKPEDSLSQNYRDFCAQFAVRQIHQLDNGKVIRDMLPDDQFLTESQFRYHFNLLLPAILQKLTPKKQKEITRRSFRIHTGSARSHIPAPGYTILIDSTVADVYLVCSFDRTKLIGRPLLYFVVDALTSTIVGAHITLRTQTAHEAKIALFTAMSDKSAWLSRYNLGAYAPLFPRAPHPYEFLPDRAELNSVAGRAAAEALSINIGMPSSYTPEWKAIVERMFKTINNLIIHWLPGSTQARARERGERDVRLDAVLTLEEFTKLILYGILMWNQRGKTTAQLLPEAVVDEVDPGPAGYYHWGLQNLHGSPRYLPEDELTVRLLQAHACEVSAFGIQLDRNRWVADWMKDPTLTLSGLIQQPAELYRHPQRASEAFVRLSGEQILRPVNMFEPPIAGTEFDIEEYMAHEKASKAIHQIKTQSFQNTLMHHSLQTVATAKRLTKAALAEKSQSKAAFIANLAENRAAELAYGEAAATLATTPPAHSPSLPSLMAGSDFLAGLANLNQDSK